MQGQFYPFASLEMTMLIRKVGLTALALSLAFGATPATAQTSETLGEYSGAYYTSGFPIAPVTVGTFSSSLWSLGVAGATISGTFGNSAFSNSAGTDLFLDGILIAQCVQFATCYSTAGPHAWSYTFGAGDLGIFADGFAILTAVQTSEYTIRLGQTTLATVPEPATVLLLAGGLFGLALKSRRRDGAFEA